MNNNQFRKLVLDKSARKDGDDSATRPPATSASLGAKKSSSVPMTPRPQSATGNVDFARQVRERHAAFHPNKKFKSSAPKGSKYGSGYTDRAKARAEAGEDKDEKGERIKALEEQVKLGQLSKETFESLRDEITGGDISSTHLVKGLDRRLLERVRRGEDVYGAGEKPEGEDPSLDVDEALDEIEGQDIQSIQREKVEKKGTKAPAPVAGVKRSRDEILAEMKAQRMAVAQAKATADQSRFDDRWKKVGQKDRPKIEIDHKGREVLTVVDENGKVKKKVRKITEEGRADLAQESVLPDVSKPVLGADAFIPEMPKPAEEAEEEDDDIFAGAGTEYNPLGDEDDDSDSDAGEKKVEASNNNKTASNTPSVREQNPTAEKSAAGPRNYFKEDTSTAEPENQDHFKGIEDVLKKAAKIGANMEDGSDDDGVEGESKAERDARQAKRAKMLNQRDRDMDDMDFGFGSSRFADEEEGDTDKKTRLSKWSDGNGGEDDGWEEKDGGGKKKRKPKKRKGDVNNAADVMRVLEGRRSVKK